MRFGMDWATSKTTSCLTEGSLTYATKISPISKTCNKLKWEQTTENKNDWQYYSLPQYLKVGISSQRFPLNSNYIFSNSTKSNGFPPSTFKSNVSRRRLLAPTIGDRRHWTLSEFSRRLAAPVVLVLSVGFVEHTCTPSKVPCTIPEFRTTSRWH